MEAVVHVTSERVNEDGSLLAVGYYTDISTDVTWDGNTATEHLLLNEWNGTVTSATNAPEGDTDVTRVLLASVALLIINLAVIIGNILVLLAVYCERALRTVTNYFIVNLAIADLLLGALVLPFSGAFEVIHYWPFGGTFCDIWAAVDVLCCTASINSLCCISVDRYIGVTKPLKHRLIMTPRRAVMINIFVWFISFGIAVGPLFGWRPVKTSEMECPLSDSIGYVFFSVAGSFYIPSAIILILYFRIYRAVSRETKSIQDRSRQRHGNTENGRAGHAILRIHVGNKRFSDKNYNRREESMSSGSSRSRNMSHRTATFNREKKVAKTLGIVVGVFIICWLPFFFLLPLRSVCRSCKLPDVVFTFFFWLGYCNSFVNPVIYGMSNHTFRKAFRKIITCWYCKDHRRSRRTFGSRRSSNVSRLTSSTPMSSPMIMSRGKRFTANTPRNALIFRRKSTSSRKCLQQTSDKQHQIQEVGLQTSNAEVNQFNGNKILCDQPLTNESHRMSTFDIESTYGDTRSLRAYEQSKPQDTSHTKHFPDKRHCRGNSRHSMSDNSNNIFDDFYEPVANSFSHCEQSLFSRTDAIKSQQSLDPSVCCSGISKLNTTVNFKQITEAELSSSIYDSRETSV
ncbi:alpha-1A adrenergic receptor-like [Acanthaster planci]|uniref:Alpha-1A adrenergic receptor-like n=1 Tax=Acanthaster planci TaxID=133434 RepID=A0A8B7YTA3_ACAPL|nr:alpha-1A adrenergic receptor-like [Acanthaster planci]XP_022096519.1 alpha-1A adrenergic receptor-like [Acanthaster planci]